MIQTPAEITSTPRSTSRARWVRGEDGILRPPGGVSHREDAFDSSWFDFLVDMQIRHFWHLGRNAFLEKALRRACRGRAGLSALDLGGGCGGWARHLARDTGELFSRIALADSSEVALRHAGTIVPEGVERYQVDAGSVPWRGEWDVLFLLDVLEHLDDDVTALREAAAAVRPGGLVIVTMPALDCFWSRNDEWVGHRRRYDRRSFERLAAETALRPLDVRYFNFFLSPLVWLSRLAMPRLDPADRSAIREAVARGHQVPAGPVNALLSAIFRAESALSGIKFPWGTSILGVLAKPK